MQSVWKLAIFVTLFSKNVWGRSLTDQDADPSYWSQYQRVPDFMTPLETHFVQNLVHTAKPPEVHYKNYDLNEDTPYMGNYFPFYHRRALQANIDKDLGKLNPKLTRPVKPILGEDDVQQRSNYRKFGKTIAVSGLSDPNFINIGNTLEPFFRGDELNGTMPTNASSDLFSMFNFDWKSIVQSFIPSDENRVILFLDLFEKEFLKLDNPVVNILWVILKSLFLAVTKFLMNTIHKAIPV